MASKAHIKAVRKYEANNYDKVTVMLPKGIKQRILDSGNTVSGFITKAVLDKLESMENKKDGE